MKTALLVKLSRDIIKTWRINGLGVVGDVFDIGTEEPDLSNVETLADMFYINLAYYSGNINIEEYELYLKLISLNIERSMWNKFKAIKNNPRVRSMPLTEKKELMELIDEVKQGIKK